MPSSIPYDHPSLVLGNIVSPVLLSRLRQISNLQAGMDAAQDKLSSYISMKRSLSMTIDELLNMKVDITGLEEKITDIDASIVRCAGEYATIRLTNETAI